MPAHRKKDHDKRPREGERTVRKGSGKQCVRTRRKIKAAQAHAHTRTHLRAQNIQTKSPQPYLFGKAIDEVTEENGRFRSEALRGVLADADLVKAPVTAIVVRERALLLELERRRAGVVGKEQAQQQPHLAQTANVVETSVKRQASRREDVGTAARHAMKIKIRAHRHTNER